MSGGRTTWWPKDAAWHRRELIVELGEEFGAEGPSVMDVLSSWAQEQRAGGKVRGGFRVLAREAFVTVSHAQSIVGRAAEIGALDDLVLDPDGRRFACRVSGWQADQARGRAALRQADKRNRGLEPDEDSVTECDVSRDVTPGAQPNLTREEKSPPYPPPSGGRKRAFSLWEREHLAWARSLGVNGSDEKLLRAIGQAEPWKRNGEAPEHFRAFVSQYFPNLIGEAA